MISQRQRWQWSMVGMVALFIAIGCGGGGGNPGSTEVEIISDANAVVYQIGDGVWKDDLTVENLTDGRRRYTFDQTGRYGVALYCKDTADKGVTVFQLTTTESRSVIQNCSRGASAVISGTVIDQTGVANIKGYALSMGMGSDGYDIVSQNNTAYSIKAAKGSRDLVTVSLAKDSNNKTVPQRFHIERGINFLGGIIGHVVTMTAANTQTMQGFGLTRAANTKGYAFLITEHEAQFRADIDDKWYLPNSGLKEKDTYLFYGVHIHHNTSYLEVYTPNSVPAEDKVINASYVAALLGTGYTKATGKFDGLDYTPSANSQPMKYFVLNTKKTATNEWYYAVLSVGWMDSEESYTLPDLSSLAGFSGIWNGQQADKVGTSVTMSNKSISEMFQTKKIYAPEKSQNYFFVIPGAKHEIAYEKIL